MKKGASKFKNSLKDLTKHEISKNFCIRCIRYQAIVLTDRKLLYNLERERERVPVSVCVARPHKVREEGNEGKIYRAPELYFAKYEEISLEK